MNQFVGVSPWKAITKDVAKKRRPPIVAAVSYVGIDALETLPLRRGDFLVCDASERAIKQGISSAKSLARYLRAGVRVFSHEGLHSKVVAAETFAWVGSANASSNSRDKLIEASVRVEGPSCRTAFEWALSLATDDSELSVQDIRALSKLPVSWQARGGEPTKQKQIIEVPHNIKRLVIVELPNEAYSYMNKEADKQIIDVRKSLRTQGARFDCFFWEDKRNRQNQRPTEGDWVIAVMNNRISKLWKIVKISRLPGYRIFWYQEMKTPLRPKFVSLRNCVKTLDEGFGVQKITQKSKIAEIRKLYGL